MWIYIIFCLYINSVLGFNKLYYRDRYLLKCILENKKYLIQDQTFFLRNEQCECPKSFEIQQCHISDWENLRENLIIQTLKKLYNKKSLDGKSLYYEFLDFHRDYIELTLKLVSSSTKYSIEQLKFVNINAYSELIAHSYQYFEYINSPHLSEIIIEILYTLLKILINSQEFEIIVVVFCSIFLTWILLRGHTENKIHLWPYKIDQKCAHKGKCILLSPKWLQQSDVEQDIIRLFISKLVPKKSWDINLNSIIANYAIGNFLCFHTGMKLSVNNVLRTVKFKKKRVPRIRYDHRYINIMDSKVIGIHQCRCVIICRSLFFVLAIYFVYKIIF